MKISIIIPVYNAEKYLGEALDSMLAQTFTDWECVCVDDGSTDGSSGILQSYAARDSRFRIIHKVNGGEGSARNRGLQEAKGKWIGWLDADDVYAPSRLAEAARLIDLEHPDLVRLTSRMAKEMPQDFEKIPVGQGDHTVLETRPAIVTWGWNVLLETGMVWNWYARRDVLEGLKFREDMRIKTDAAFSISLVPRLTKVCHKTHGSIFYRILPTSAIHSARRAVDTCRFLSVLLDVWHQQREYAESLGMSEELRGRLRYTAECDIISWIYFSGHEKAVERSAVRKAYEALKGNGAFSKRWQINQRYRVAMPLYDMFGWSLPIWLTEAVCRLGGGIIRGLRNII